MCVVYFVADSAASLATPNINLTTVTYHQRNTQPTNIKWAANIQPILSACFLHTQPLSHRRPLPNFSRSCPSTDMTCRRVHNKVTLVFTRSFKIADSPQRIQFCLVANRWLSILIFSWFILLQSALRRTNTRSPYTVQSFESHSWFLTWLCLISNRTMSPCSLAMSLPPRSWSRERKPPPVVEICWTCHLVEICPNYYLFDDRLSNINSPYLFETYSAFEPKLRPRSGDVG